METTRVYSGYKGIMEKKMETTIYNGIIFLFAIHENFLAPMLRDTCSANFLPYLRPVEQD